MIYALGKKRQTYNIKRITLLKLNAASSLVYIFKKLGAFVIG